ncbi:MAG: hypothetical protein HOW73_08110 [Polyangiaceae bacterium]|nr:hypothetical protein [Polyangiaceae bacterium]
MKALAVTLGLGLTALGASCALTFDDYPTDEGAGGEGGSTTATGSATESSSSSGGQGGGTPEPTCVRTVLAIDQLLVGDILHPEGWPSPYAWKQYGANIDDDTTSNDYTMHCTPNSGGSAQQAFLDGNDGIDNSFGHNLLPVFAGLSADVNSSITSGNVGYLFDLVGLTADANQADITTRFYSAAQLDHDPVFDGSDCWDVDGASVTDPNDVGTAKSVFTGGLLTTNEWRSGLPQTVVLTVQYQGIFVPLTLHHAMIWAPLTSEHDATEPGAIGQISGVLDTEELVTAVSRYIHTWSPEDCVNFPNVATAIRQASDIMVDGTQDPGETCNGISIGLGFTVKRALLGGVGPASSLPMVGCR